MWGVGEEEEVGRVRGGGDREGEGEGGGREGEGEGGSREGGRRRQ